NLDRPEGLPHACDSYRRHSSSRSEPFLCLSGYRLKKGVQPRAPSPSSALVAPFLHPSVNRCRFPFHAFVTEISPSPVPSRRTEAASVLYFLGRCRLRLAPTAGRRFRRRAGPNELTENRHAPTRRQP